MGSGIYEKLYTGLYSDHIYEALYIQLSIIWNNEYRLPV